MLIIGIGLGIPFWFYPLPSLPVDSDVTFRGMETTWQGGSVVWQSAA